MTRDVKRSDRRRRLIRRLLFGPALVVGIGAGTIAFLVPAVAVLMLFDGLGMQTAWLMPVVALPCSILFYQAAARTTAALSDILERIAGVEDDLTAFLRQVNYIETGPEDGYWIDRSGRVYKDEAALMRGADRFAQARSG